MKTEKLIFISIFAANICLNAEQALEQEIQAENLSVQVDETIETKEDSIPVAINVNHWEFDQNPPFPSLKQYPQKELFDNAKPKASYNLLAYGHLEMVLPGVGLAIRSYGEEISFEGNISIIMNLPALKCSFSFLKNFSQSDLGWYGEVGIGTFLPITKEGIKIALYIPIAIGHQGEAFFSDIGIDLFMNRNLLIPLPTIRCGVRF